MDPALLECTARLQGLDRGAPPPMGQDAPHPAGVRPFCRFGRRCHRLPKTGTSASLLLPAQRPFQRNRGAGQSGAIDTGRPCPCTARAGGYDGGHWLRARPRCGKGRVIDGANTLRRLVQMRTMNDDIERGEGLL